MPTPEEIKKIASEYGESEANCFDYDMYSNPDFRHKLKAKSEANKAKAVLEWLSRDYCIVPKSKVKEMYEKSKTMIRSNSIIDQDCGIVRNSLMDYLFGKSLFEDEQK